MKKEMSRTTGCFIPSRRFLSHARTDNISWRQAEQRVVTRVSRCSHLDQTQTSSITEGRHLSLSLAREEGNYLTGSHLTFAQHYSSKTLRYFSPASTYRVHGILTSEPVNPATVAPHTNTLTNSARCFNLSSRYQRPTCHQ